MAEQPVPLPTGFNVAEDFPKGRERLVNCFNVGDNRVMTRPCVAGHTTAVSRCRGQAFYRRRLFQASGTRCIIISSTPGAPFTDLGELAGADDVIFARGHTAMAIVPRGAGLYKWEDTGGNGTLTDISTSPNFPGAIDAAFMDGRWYYVPPDGGPVVYSEVGDPGDIDPLNFFDAELLPDLTRGIINVRNTLYVLGEDSIELFRTGTDTNAVPRRVTGGQIQSGYLGGRIEYDVSFAYVGRNVEGEAGIFVAGSGRAIKISNDAVDDLLKKYTDAEISLVKAQRYTWHGLDTLVFTFLEEALGYAGGEWFPVASQGEGSQTEPWRAIFSTYAYGRNYVGDLNTADVGTLQDIDTDYGEEVIREIYTFFRVTPNANFDVTAINLDARAGLVPTIGIVPDVTRKELHVASQWQVATDMAFSNIVYDSQETITDLQSITLPSPLDSNEQYYWRVRYKGEVSGWSDYSAPTAFTTIVTGINPPINIIPANGQLDVDLDPTLSATAFNPIGGPQNHINSQWQVATDVGFSSIVFDSGSDPVNLTSITVTPDLAEDTQYYWRVRYEGDVSGFSDYSTPTTFTTALVSVVNTPTNISPVDQAVDVAPDVTLTASMFSFGGPTQTHVNSQWQVATDPDFNTIVRDSGDDPVNLESYPVTPDLGPLETYYWRVRYEGDLTGYSNYSTATEFTTEVRPQNKVDASAPAWMRETNQAFMPTNAIALSCWFQFDPNVPTMNIIDGSSTTLQSTVTIAVTSTGSLFISAIDQVGNVRKAVNRPAGLIAGEWYNLLVSFDDTASSVVAYVNDTAVDLTGITDGAGNWSMANINEWGLLNRSEGGSASASAFEKVADLWVNNGYIDFSIEANRRDFITEGGDSVDLGVNGETPLGSAPTIFYGSNYNAANWNSAINLGSGPNFPDDIGSGDNFTDVT